MIINGGSRISPNFSPIYNNAQSRERSASRQSCSVLTRCCCFHLRSPFHRVRCVSLTTMKRDLCCIISIVRRVHKPSTTIASSASLYNLITCCVCCALLHIHIPLTARSHMLPSYYSIFQMIGLCRART